MDQGQMHWPSRIGSWLVLLVGLVLMVFIIGTWVDALSRVFAPDMPADPALANEATLAPNAFSGMLLISAAIGTIPLAAALWGLWHLYRLLCERGVGAKVSVAMRLRSIGLSLMVAAMLIAGLSFGYAVTTGSAPSYAVLPSHIAIFGVGVVVVLIGIWRGRPQASPS